MNKHLFVSRIFVLVLLVLEASPYGVVLNFMPDYGVTVKSYFSYFDLTPFGYAVFGPLIAAIFTVLLAALMIVSLFWKSTLQKKILASLSVFIPLAAVSPLALGLRYMTVISWCVTIISVCMSVILYRDASVSEKKK